MTDNTESTYSGVVIRHTFKESFPLPIGEYVESKTVAIKDSQFTIRFVKTIDNTFKPCLYYEGVKISCETISRWKYPHDSGWNLFSSSVLYYYNGEVVDIGQSFFYIQNPITFEVTIFLHLSEQPKERKFSQIFEQFLTSQHFSDIIIKADNEVIPAHKMVLAMHSPVFHAMLQSGMLESTTNEIIITDFNVDIVKAFLTCLYTQSIDPSYSFELCLELYAMTNKYDVKSLQSALTEKLWKYVTIDNCISLLIRADNSNWTTIKAKLLTYIAKNWKDIKLKNKLQINELSRELHVELLHSL